MPFRHKDVCQDLSSRAAGRGGKVFGRLVLFTCVLSLLLQQGEDRRVTIYQHMYLFYAAVDTVRFDPHGPAAATKSRLSAFRHAHEWTRY